MLVGAVRRAVLIQFHQGFLRFLEKGMAEHPELIEPVDRAQLKRIGKLVAGVKTD